MWQTLIGACLVSAPIVWIIQAVDWFKGGYWPPFPLSVITGRMSGSDFLGLQLIVNWVADINLGIVLIVLAWVLYWVGKHNSD